MQNLLTDVTVQYAQVWYKTYLEIGHRHMSSQVFVY